MSKKIKENLAEIDQDLAFRKVVALLGLNNDGQLVIKKSKLQKSDAYIDKCIKEVFGTQASFSSKGGLDLPFSDHARSTLKTIALLQEQVNIDEILKGIKIKVDKTQFNLSTFVRKENVSDEQFEKSLDYLMQAGMDLDVFLHHFGIEKAVQIFTEQIKNNEKAQKEVIDTLAGMDMAAFGEDKIVFSDRNDWDYAFHPLCLALGADFGDAQPTTETYKTYYSNSDKLKVMEAKTEEQKNLLRKIQNYALAKALQPRLISVYEGKPVFKLYFVQEYEKSENIDAGTITKGLFQKPKKVTCADLKGRMVQGVMFEEMTPMPQVKDDFDAIINDLKADFETRQQKEQEKQTALNNVAKKGLCARLFGKEKTL